MQKLKALSYIEDTLLMSRRYTLCDFVMRQVQFVSLYIVSRLGGYIDRGDSIRGVLIFQ